MSKDTLFQYDWRSYSITSHKGPQVPVGTSAGRHRDWLEARGQV